MSDTIGVIGLGSMGSGIAGRLLSGGPVVVYDIDEAAMSRLSARGAIPAANAAGVANEGDIVFLSLPNTEVAEAVLFGANGVALGERVRIVVDLSTTGSEFATRTSARLAEAGIDFVSAPVSGGMAKAAAGELSVLVSGKAESIEKIRPYLQQFGTAVFVIGPSPKDAQIAKLMNNLLNSVGFVVACEAMIVAARAGLDPDVLISTFNASSGRNNATLTKIPDAVLTRTFDHGASVGIGAKDAELGIREAELLGVDMTVARTTLPLWTRALNDLQHSQDNSMLITLLEREYGVTVKGKAAHNGSEL
ncbi:NAD(P)-dependent oxidoreductase [Sinorhizobium medicae]|uniref:NAD(P)-dependent oxidoreductase n=1 Tax=Sinorhizobium medicae TaxID=110321 RepID=UPI000FDB0BBC|nr:NAD(P)-dependent oxidoreductase [Sinorhizobium medicae]RVO73541.1 NAD(P)-dependent oxidoreductase [Sinorhizobium medicae]